MTVKQKAIKTGLKRTDLRLVLGGCPVKRRLLFPGKGLCTFSGRPRPGAPKSVLDCLLNTSNNARMHFLGAYHGRTLAPLGTLAKSLPWVKP